MSSCEEHGPNVMVRPWKATGKRLTNRLPKLSLITPTTTRVPGTGVDGHATHVPTTRVPATGVDGHEPAVTVTSRPRLNFRKLLDIRLQKSGIKNPSK